MLSQASFATRILCNHAVTLCPSVSASKGCEAASPRGWEIDLSLRHLANHWRRRHASSLPWPESQAGRDIARTFLVPKALWLA